MANHSSILAWKIPWTEEPGGPQSMGSQRVGHDLATETTPRGTRSRDFVVSISGWAGLILGGLDPGDVLQSSLCVWTVVLRCRVSGAGRGWLTDWVWHPGE